MGRRVDVDDLLDTAGIAALLGVGRSVVYDWLTRHAATFPAPVVERSGVRLWLREDIERWARSTGRLPED